MTQELLVIGAREGSLGSAVAKAAKASGAIVVTAGIHDEEVPLDVRAPEQVNHVFAMHRWSNVIYTAGVNAPTTMLPEKPPTNADVLHLSSHFADTMAVNFTGAMTSLYSWLNHFDSGHRNTDSFVVIGSNSAHIPRTRSSAYGASKAALSIGIRSVAREIARDPRWKGGIYGYEPCWIDGTPMSDEVRSWLDAGQAPHRIPGGHGLDRDTFAQFIMLNLLLPDSGKVLHGSMLRVDLCDN